MTEIIRIILSYLIGSISGSMVIGKFKKVDIREMGSGNAGGTNAFRTQGALFALGVIIIDIFKGFAATYYIGMGFGDVSSLSLTCGFASVIGHIYPIYHQFKGGKGAGTLIGVLLALPLSGIVIPTLILIWLVILVITGYVGLGTIITGISFPIYLYLFNNQVPELMIFGMLCSILIIFTHRSNIIRMYRGEENQFEKIMIFKKILK
ncbi:MAG: acyl-phosphate glycerol 3-phosphate acyltransferase [Candidatus Marinimicrobia bacterium]|nr:acyl-phosphate glycerol 3-phosphate acyltransferase [Candidatus Neomarinimicrobiota bacterium]|tara:strand:+ start:6966 stop:7586 length:621 start_codon:yes stop_codon:yes gene_type:complete